MEYNKNCPLCDRPMPPSQQSSHHLIPSCFGGKKTVDLHKICHNQIHALFSERELLNYYHTIERLKNHEKIKSFIKWVKKKPNDFYVKSKMSNRIRR